MSTFWGIMVACNDPDNGIFRGALSDIHLVSRDSNGVDIALELANQFIPPAMLAFRREGDRVRIGRKWFHIQNYREWVGNWCWDMIITDAETTAAILNHVCAMTLHGKKKLVPEAGWTSIWDLYTSGTFSAEALDAMLKEHINGD